MMDFSFPLPPFKLFNTLSRSIEPINPIHPPQITLYACGPTVYNLAHIGNFRTFLCVDLLRRALELFGYKVTHVMNYTDVDDKTIAASRAAGISLAAYTQRYIDEFEKDMRTLNMLKPHFQPRATEHIEKMIEFIRQLLEKDHAYIGQDGSVYFRISSFPDYGKLSHLDKEKLKIGTQVFSDEYVKENYGDFALWKAKKAEDGDVGWISPWEIGRPGWHIECSTMSICYLGKQIDIHCGGVDLIFPHHENEIAQSESMTGTKFVRHWFHVSHVLVEGEKMSKSLGNIYTLRDVLNKGFSARVLRYHLLTSSHYRQTLNFSWHGMESSREALKRIDSWLSRQRDIPPSQFLGHETDEQISFNRRFLEALADDLNITEAVGHLFDWIRLTNRMMDEGKQLPPLYKSWQLVDSLLGVGELNVEIPPEIQSLLSMRAEARKKKDWQTSDRLRQALLDKGWIVQDTPEGQKAWKE
ncbi:cysteine--tRNA ligase [Methylacidiphilum caldifontis]|uniref:cysteine--tRNA ligase n=1 Tax=Methylacidiphilum caldifontis TaxID=2795386 RepID=UPI001A8CD4FD|nr:cysteine--tRNA ligase [Methylacidiphilum caldifontis]QSR88525.1 cysteine--tRNA ligase [Methylacidiphilum caldifontis]